MQITNIPVMYQSSSNSGLCRKELNDLKSKINKIHNIGLSYVINI